MSKAHLYLAIAIVAEVVATSALKASDNFSKWLPSIIVVVGYGVAFNYLSLVLKEIPVGVAYAVWSGAGIVLITLVGSILFRQAPDFAAILGIALIIAGIVILNLFSKTPVH